MRARLEAERVERESNPKLIAGKRNQDLRRKFGVDGLDGLGFKRLMTTLRKLDGGSRLSEEEAVWLASEGRRYASTEIWHAHNCLEANVCLAEFKRTCNI